MPQVRHYTVRETREVKLWTNSAVEASVLASETFAGKRSIDLVPGEITSQPRVVALDVREDPK
jgi:hypothetical protein